MEPSPCPGLLGDRLRRETCNSLPRYLTPRRSGREKSKSKPLLSDHPEALVTSLETTDRSHNRILAAELESAVPLSPLPAALQAGPGPRAK
ncbi:uncharacterized protein LOC123383162 isoform X2 [Felis catus]|uniref:uncharacterized protein LOC123383162 isoform X2 n=1 Tax=Felis catus TaxID=9685 RepID=UPI001D1A007B|nr:uncharacterized protein LOC123383162 isoform X2 [Felis catus]